MSPTLGLSFLTCKIKTGYALKYYVNSGKKNNPEYPAGGATSLSKAHTHGWTDRQMDACMHAYMDRPTDGQMKDR